MQQGESRGRRQGEALVLLRQLNLKFGELPQDVLGRVEAADDDTLLEWSERILTAKTLGEVIH